MCKLNYVPLAGDGIRIVSKLCKCGGVLQYVEIIIINGGPCMLRITRFFEIGKSFRPGLKPLNLDSLFQNVVPDLGFAPPVIDIVHKLVAGSL